MRQVLGLKALEKFQKFLCLVRRRAEIIESFDKLELLPDDNFTTADVSLDISSSVSAAALTDAEYT